MKELITKNFILNYQEGLDDFIQESLHIVDMKMPLIKEILTCDDAAVGQLKASFFTNRNDFVGYIESISNGEQPPVWATGCFCNGGIQALVDVNNKNDIKFKVHTLTHEMVHLFIQKLIYQQYEIDRIRWFDESYASYIDGRTEKLTLDNLKYICYKLKPVENLDVNCLDDINKVKTKDYNAYDIFLVIGRYIFENNLAKDYIELIKNNPLKIRELGLSILKDSIKYIEQS